MKRLVLISCLSVATFLKGCATPHVVSAVDARDNTFSCNRLLFEMNEADRFRSEAQREKGVTGTNVAAVLFFWPAMIGTYANANEAIAAADTRKAHLLNLYNQKKCSDEKAPANPGERISAEKASAEIRAMKARVEERKLTDAEFERRRQALVDRLY
jgi:hypothetical protein